MSYGNKSFWKRTLAFVLTVLLVITSTPFSMQKVKAADTEFSIKLVYDESGANKEVEEDTAQLIFTKGNKQYTYKAIKDSTNAGQYKFTVADGSGLLTSDKISYDSLTINIDGYKKTEITNQGEIAKDTAAEFKVVPKKDGAAAIFAGGDKTISYSDTEDGIYDVSSILNVTITPEDDNALAGKTVKYNISGGNIPSSDSADSIASQAENTNKASIDSDGKITGLTASDKAYVITAVVSFDDYKDATATMNLTVEKAVQDSVMFTNGENAGITFDNSQSVHEYTNVIAGVKENAVITYAIDTTSDADIATVDNTGKVKYSKAGTVKVNATIASTDNYKEKTISYTLVIGKQSVEGFTFNKKTDTVTYGENNNKYSQSVQHSSGNIGNITYSITDDSGNSTDVADINSHTGELNIKKAGTVKVTAQAAETDTYGSTSASYTLVIKKADRTISFNNTDARIYIDYNADDSSYTNIASVSAGTSVVKYSIVSGAGQVDTNGQVTYSSTGDIKVKATVAADNCYNECSAEYTLTVKYAQAERYDKYVEISGATKNNSGWYTGEVTILAEPGYTIRKADNEAWQSSVVINNDGEYSNYIIEVKAPNGVVYNSVKVPDFKIDSTAPENVSIKYDSPIADKFLNTITFGYYKKDVKVTITVKDETSGVKSLKYIVIENPGTDKEKNIDEKTVHKNELSFSNDKKTASYSFQISTRSKIGVVYEATDAAGCTSQQFTDGKVIVIDDKAPEITYTFDNSYKDKVSADNNSVESGEDIRYIYDKDVTGSINISDDNINADTISIQIIKDGSEYKTINISDQNFVKENNATYVYAFNLTEEGSYEIITKAQDYSGNGKNLQKIWKCVVDKTAPVIDIQYEDTLKDTKYLSEKKTVITITEKNLRTSDIEASVTATDSLNNPTDVNVKLLDKNGKYTEIKLSQLSSVIKEEEYWIKNADEWTATIILSNDAEYKDFKVSCQDLADNNSESTEQTGFVIDKTVPDVSFEMADADYNTDNAYYYGDKISAVVTIKVHDEHFNNSLIKVTDSLNKGNAVIDESELTGLNWKRVQTDDGKDTNTWTTSVNVSDKEGINIISVSGSDTYGNSIAANTNSSQIIADHTKPVISVEYDDDNSDIPETDGVKYFKKQRTATITIKEANFDAEKVEAVVTAKNYSGEDITNIDDYNSILKNPLNWSTGDNGEHVARIKFKENANYSFDIKCTDLVNLESEPRAIDKFTIDGEAPKDYKIEYPKSTVNTILDTITFGLSRLFYQDECVVTISAKDDIAGIQKLVYSISNEDADNTGNYVVNNKEVYVDVSNTDFKVSKDGSVSYTFKIPAQANGKVSFTAYDYSGNPDDGSIGKTDNDNIVIVDKISPEVSVEYTGNFIEKYNSKNIYNGSVTAQLKIDETYFYEENVVISATKNGIETTDFQKKWLGKDADGKYICNVTFTNDGDYTLIVDYHDMSGNYMIANNVQTSQTDKYVSDIFTIDTTRPVVNVSYDKYTDNAIYVPERTATITVTEMNFRPDEIEAGITAKDISGNDVTYTVPNLKNQSSWKRSESASDTWIASIVFDTEAVYGFNISYSDIAKNPAEYTNSGNVKYDTYAGDGFTVVKSAPSDLKIVSVSSNYKNTWNRILNAVTFGYYSYQDEVTVTIQATDRISGVERFEWEYNRESGASTENTEKLTGRVNSNAIIYSADKKVATASITIPADRINYQQIRGSISFIAYNEAGISSSYADNHTVVIVDTISPERTVEFSPAKQVADSVMYYDDTASVRFNVKEANFYPEDVKVSVNDELTSLTWNKSEAQDTWYADMNMSGDGDYVVKMAYTDRSANVMNEYVSDKIVIDTVNPVMNVTYTNSNVINDVAGNKIYDSNQTAVITINEHNFRASDVNVNITAGDINGNSVGIPDYSSYLKNAANWNNAGDIHTAQITFSTEANYSFNISYTDMAQRTTGDYSTDYFTVDKSSPYDISVSYSSSIIDTILQTITFGFYNAPVNVTVEVKDDISAINRIEYNYNRNSEASGINEEKIAAVINNSELTQTGNTAATQFSIPQNQVSQLNGTMYLKAYDNAGNSSDYDDSRRIVVDNIMPNAAVTYSDPVQNYNGISYYAGDIEATITVNEANFYSEDMVINVSNDGNNYPVNPQWSDIDADTHIGTFTISGDGDYYVSISYTDKSSNVMENYTSEQMTIDTQIPTVSISNIKNNSANKESKYTFTITANDTNFDVSGFTPVLRAVMKDASGNYSIREISLGTVNEVEAGKTYSFTVDNLDEDAVYTLTCVIRDLAGNEYSKVLLDDGQEYDNVVFSINRNGSTFSVDNSTETLLNNYYVYEVNKDVVVYETNVDPINNYKVKLNGNELRENTDYTTTMTDNVDEWAIRTYNINRNLFSDEGEYKIVVESTDKTNTSAYSDVKNMNISFTVDKTAPILTVSGLENGGRYQNTEQEVTVLATDDGGSLNSFKVEVFDSSNNPVSGDGVRFDKSGEELTQYLASNDGKITFTVPEGLSQNVVLTCSDAAVHEDGSTNVTVQQFTKITVSPSGMVMFYANKPLFYGIIIAGVLVISGVAFCIVLKVRKSKVK